MLRIKISWQNETTGNVEVAELAINISTNNLKRNVFVKCTFLGLYNQIFLVVTAAATVAMY